MKKYKSYLPWLLLLLLFCDVASLADLSNPMTAQNCQLTANPDECLRKATNQSGTPINLNNYSLTSDTLGLSGPLSFTVSYDEDLALVLGVGYTQMFNEMFGLSGKFTFGQNERRANLTSGFAISKDQNIKLTYEYLAQNQNFDFTSGAVQQWVDQHAVGGAYQYLLRHEILHSLEISGYTIRANSKDLSNVIFNQTGNDYDVNYRRIAGGTENTVQAAFNVLPLKNTALTVGGGYSQLTYDTQYSASPLNSGLAYKLELTHVLTPKVKMTATVNETASGREHSAQLSHILPKNVEVSVKAQYVAGAAGLSDSKNVALTFSYPAPKHYSLNLDPMQELHNWIEKPVVYATRVLAVKDEKVAHYSFTGTNPPDQTKSNNSTDATQREINPVATQDYFQFADPNLTVEYTASVTCPAAQPQDQCNLNDLGIHLVSSGNQATLSSFTLIPPDTAVGDYVITITGRGTQPGLTPVTTAVHFTLNITTTGAQWATTSGTLKFDAAPIINQTLGQTVCTGGIVLQLKDTDGNLENPNSVVWSSGSKPGYWALQQDGQQWCLMRDTSSSDLNGNLNAADVGNTVNLDLCAYETAGSQSCIRGIVAATVTGDNSTDGSGASVIGAQIADPYDVKAGDSFNNWDATTNNGLASYYKLPAATIPIVGDSYSSWSNAQIPSASNPAAWPSISIYPSTGIMSGTAPAVTGTYQKGSFTVTSLKAAANNNVTASFQALVGDNDPPDIHSINGTMRYSFTNNNNSSVTNSGLGMQSGDQLIDLNTMVNNATNPTFAFTTDGAQKIPSWQIVQGNPAWEGDPNHWYLFRDLNSSKHLDAANVNTSQAVYICVTANGYTPNCSQKVTVQVTPETNASYVTVAINDSSSNPSFIYGSGNDVGTSNNPAPNALSKSVSNFVGGQFPGDSIIPIDNDVRSVVSPAMTTLGKPTWDNYFIAAGTLPDGGALTGTAPTVSSDSIYTSSFTAHSDAKGGNVATVQFHSKVLAAGLWINTSGAIKFDTIAVDSGDQVNLSAKVNPAMVIDSFSLGSSVAGNYNPANWQVLTDNTGGVTTYYLARKANGSDIDATETSSVIQVPISVTGILSGSTVTSSTVLNVTVNPDANVYYQYTGSGSANSPISPVVVAAAYPDDSGEVPNTHIVFGSNNVMPKVTISATTYNVVNDDATTYNFPSSPRSYISYPGNSTIKFTYAPSTDLGDALSLVQSIDSTNIQATSKAHGIGVWGTMQGLDVQVNDLSVATSAPEANKNIQCFNPNVPVSSQRSIYYTTVPLSSGRTYYIKGGVSGNLSTSTPGGANITRTVCPGNPGIGTNYSTAQGNNIDASDSRYDCSEPDRDGAAYSSPTTATTQLPAIRSSGAGANLLTFFVTETNVGCTTSGGGTYPRINSPMVLTISSSP